MNPRAWLVRPVSRVSSCAIDAATLAYAGWTLTCHAVVLLGGSARTLATTAISVVVIGGVAGVGYAVRRRIGWGAGTRVGTEAESETETEAETEAETETEAEAETETEAETESATGTAADSAAGSRARLLRHAAIWLLAVVTVALWPMFHDPMLQWVAICTYLLAALVLSAREPIAPAAAPSARDPRWQELLLWSLAAASSFLALYVHRWRNDDCYYVNLAVTMVDSPNLPLLAFNTIHAPNPADPLANATFPPYRVHSFEALGGLISMLTGISALQALHVVVTAVTGACLPLALARLFRLLDPQRWIFMLLAAICLYLFEGSSGLGYGNQGIVRMFTGKSVMLSVAVPLMVRHGMAFGLDPSRRNWLLLAATQIAAVGLTSTALWLAPVASGLGVLCTLPLRVKSLRTLGLALLSSAYVVAIALWVRAQLLGGGGAGDPDAAGAVAVAPIGLSLRFDLLLSAFEQLFAVPNVMQVFMALLLFAIPASRSPLGRRYVIVFCLALVLVLMNPYFANFLRYNLLGRYTGQRTMWLAPVPTALALVFAALIPARRSRLWRGVGVLAMAGALWLFFAKVPAHSILTSSNNVALRWPPGPKVPTGAFAIVTRLHELLQPGELVLAPELVSWYLPTVHRHPYPLLANAKYLAASGAEEKRRKQMVRAVSGEGKFRKKERDRFAEDLNSYPIAAIVTHSKAMRFNGLTDTIKAAGFRRAKGGLAGYQLWLRRDRLGEAVSPAPALLIDLAVVAFALWTVAANLVVIARGTSAVLLAAAAACVALLVAVAAFVRSRPAWRSAYLADLADPPPQPRAVARSTTWRLLILPGATLAVWLVTNNLWLTWILALLASVALCFEACREPLAQAGEPPADSGYSRRELLVLHALAFGCALFTLLAVRPRSDDSFYLNMAIAVVDYPEQALLSLKNLHGPATGTLAAQPMFPPYKAHSFELLGGVISYATGIEAARVIHFGLATLLGWLTPFALARLLRMLIPRDWLFGLLVVLSLYVIEGTASRGYANHALVRLFNGKAALLTLGVPLICAYGLRFGRSPSRLRLGMLALAQIAAIGLSSTALWLAPVLAMVSVVAATPGRRELVRSVLGGLASSAYVLAIGGWVMSQMSAGVVEPVELDLAADSGAAAVQAAIPAMPSGFARLAETFSVVLGPEHTAIHLLAVGLLAAVVAQTVLGARLFSLILLVLTLGFANPLLADTIAGYVTGATTYHRVLWLLPIPIALAVCATRLFGWLSGRFARPLAYAVCAAALSLFYLVTTERLVISEANGAKLQWPPALKLPPQARKVAQEICRWAPAGKYVLASQSVMQQLPTLHGCGYPLLAADRWLVASTEDKAARIELVGFVDKAGEIPRDHGAWFVGALSRYGIDAIVLSREASRSARTKSLVRMAGFERVGEIEWEQIFVRARPQTYARDARIARKTCDITGTTGHVLAPFDVSAAIDEIGCAQALAAPARLEASPLDDLELLDLERLTYMASDLPESRSSWLRRAVEKRAIDTIVFSSQGAKNRRFKALLAGLGFRKVGTANDHSLFRRLPATP